MNLVLIVRYVQYCPSRSTKIIYDFRLFVRTHIEVTDERVRLRMTDGIDLRTHIHLLLPSLNLGSLQPSVNRVFVYKSPVENFPPPPE